ncbi:esterase/lipase family protein [Rubripirellula lacrimiformis]|nr:alpha/beta fold hydrolase [Rubripirellula lacrimiformis]
MVACLAGCVTPSYLSSRKIRDNPLTSTLHLVGPKGPEISERTWNTLRRFDLEDRYQTDSRVCFEHIRQRVAENPEAELIYALSELAYVEGKKAERAGRGSDALNQYGVALTNSYDYLFSDDIGTSRNYYDPQFRGACDLYNESLEDTLRLLCEENRIQPGQTYTIKTEDREFVVRTEMRGQWKTDEFDHYEFVSDYEIETLRNQHTTYGLGVPLIAVRRPPTEADQREKYYPKGLSYSVTALMRCVEPKDGGRPGDSKVCVLEFFDPLKANQIQLAEQWVPLETDLTTPLAYFLDSPEFRKRNAATEGLLNPNDSVKSRGLYMLEPYDPNRIPVLMVHGLWSSPMTWMDMFNDLRSFPEIRERYQFWFYLYPSGQPFWLSATQLRSDLTTMRKAFDQNRRDRPMDQMVLVGHSMGGLVSRMQTIDSGDEFWKIVSNEPVRDADDAIAKLKGDDDDRFKLVSTLFFRPNSSVKRVITIGTPHRGSEFANDYTRWLARKFIKLPTMAVGTGVRLAEQNPSVFKDTQLLTVANAIDSLAPESPIFPVMMRAKRAPGVKYHNIIGVLENPSLITGRTGRGDGVVEYASAHMEDTESELVIDAPHTSVHMTPKAVFEVRRILLEHLKELDSGDRIAASDPLRGAGDPLVLPMSSEVETGELQGSVFENANANWTNLPPVVIER